MGNQDWGSLFGILGNLTKGFSFQEGILGIWVVLGPIGQFNSFLGEGFRRNWYFRRYFFGFDSFPGNPSLLLKGGDLERLFPRFLGPHFRVWETRSSPQGKFFSFHFFRLSGLFPLAPGFWVHLGGGKGLFYLFPGFSFGSPWEPGYPGGMLGSRVSVIFVGGFFPTSSGGDSLFNKG